MGTPFQASRSQQMELCCPALLGLVRVVLDLCTVLVPADALGDPERGSPPWWVAYKRCLAQGVATSGITTTPHQKTGVAIWLSVVVPGVRSPTGAREGGIGPCHSQLGDLRDEDASTQVTKPVVGWQNAWPSTLVPTGSPFLPLPLSLSRHLTAERVHRAQGVAVIDIGRRIKRNGIIQQDRTSLCCPEALAYPTGVVARRRIGLAQAGGSRGTEALFSQCWTLRSTM